MLIIWTRRKATVHIGGAVSYIPKFGDAASLSGDAIVSHWRSIISFIDALPPHLHPHVR
jgi:hypothetical protein